MAKPTVVSLFLFLALLASPGTPALPADAAPDPGEGVVYRGPVAFDDPSDPLFALRWTLGAYQPRRLSLALPPRLAIERRVLYDLDYGRVLVTYRAGQEDIRPPLAYLPETYGDAAFHDQFRRSWLQGTEKSLAEAKARGGTPEGLIDLTLPVTIPFTEKLFGQGAPNLKVRGSEQITISGSSSWVVGQVTGEQGGNSLFPKLDMRQRLNVGLEGTIGSKLSLSMAQNSDAITPLENSVKIRYKGEDDEVLRGVDLGNTNLSLPPTQFVSYSARQEGLFGIKTEAQVGPLEITAIASREQGQAGQATFTGGAQTKKIRIPDWNYVYGKYFFLVDPNGDAPPPEKILEVRLYLDDKTAINNDDLGAVPARIWIDPSGRTPAEPVLGDFHSLQNVEDYQLINDSNFSFPMVVLNTPLSPFHTLAVAYKQETGGIQSTVGTLPATQDEAPDTLDLKMLRPSEEDWKSNDLTLSPWAPVRSLEARNVYSLQVREIERGTLTLDVVRDVAGADGNNPITLRNEWGKQTKLIEVLGLDQKNNTDPSNRTPDGKVDNEFIDYENGLIFFPDLRPFDPNLADIEGKAGVRAKSWPRAEGVERPDTLGYTKAPGTGEAVLSRAEIRSQETVPEIYDLLYRELSRTASDHHLYTIEADVQAAVSSTIQLGALGGVLEGSETVRLNGEELRRGEDYTIVYETGEVTLRNPEATAPGADLVITYSQDALFARGSQSLLGTTISTRRDQTSALSFSTTWLHQSRGVPDRRPRLRGEPSRTTVGDFAGRLKLDPWALTDLVDALPLVSANLPSRVELTGAMGLSFPNPNTRGEVFIDDMEGSEVTVSTGVNRASWIYSSVPRRGLDYFSARTTTPAPFTPVPEDRGQLLWFSPNTVQVEDLFPREDAELERNDPVPVLETIYAPSDSSDLLGAWAGLVTSLGIVDVSRSQFLEIWVNDYIPFERTVERRGEILIDVGTVSEDAVWDPQTPPLPANGILDVEDKNQNGGQVEFNEDTGLDGVRNEQEPVRRPGTTAFTPFDARRDPSADDRVPEVEESAPENSLGQRVQKYLGINGSEDNQRADGEDLDGDYYLDTDDDYREYRIDLQAPAYIDVRRDFAVADPNNGWRLYRIPLNAHHQDVGVVNLSQAKHLRMWFRGVAPGDTLDLQVASIEIVGNRWELADTTRAAADEVVNIGVVSNKKDTDYVEPFEVRRVDNVKEREQSISLDFENLQPGTDALAFRRLQDTYDYTLYQSVGFYLNPRFQSFPQDTLEFYLRFGSDAATDTSAYYEVATRISEGDPRRRSNGWMNFEFPVTALSSLKIQDPPASPRQDIGNGLLGTAVGNPSMSRVRRISFGVRNVSGRVLPRGSVWFNELRMGDVRRDVGWASRASANLVLSDFANLNGSVDFQNPDFLRLGQSQGSGTENLRYDLRGQVGLHKFMEPLHITAPISARLTRSRQTPKFAPNSDVLYEGPKSGAAITETMDRGADLSLSRDARGLGNPLLRYTLDAIRLSGGVSETFRTDVTRADTTRRWVGNASYTLNLGHIRPLRPLGLVNIKLWPQNVGVNLAGSRQTSRVWTPLAAADTGSADTRVLTSDSVTKSGNLSLTAGLQPVSGITYTYGSERDLIDEHFGPDSAVVRRARIPLRVLGVGLGREVQQNHTLAFNYTPPLLGRTLSPRFSWTGNSTQNLRPDLTLEDYENAVFNISNSDNASLSISVPLGRAIEGLVGKPTPTKGAPPARPPRSRARADTTDVPPPPKGEPGARQFFTKILRFKDIQANGTLGHRSAYDRVHGTPSPVYRLGLTRDIGLGEDVFTEPRAAFNQSLGRTTTLRGTTSMTLFNQVGMDVSYQKRNDLTENNSQLGRVTEDTTWPELRFDWGDLQKNIPLVRKVFADFRAVNTSYSRATRTTGTVENPDEETTVTTNWRPLVSIQGSLPGGWRTTLNANLSTTDTRSARLGSAATTTHRTSDGYQISLNKKFIGVGGSKSKDVDLKVDVNYTRTTSETRSSYSDRVQEDQRDQLRLNGSAGLRLTQALSGTFGLELGQERRPTTDWTRRSVRIYFTTGFNF